MQNYELIHLMTIFNHLNEANQLKAVNSFSLWHYRHYEDLNSLLVSNINYYNSVVEMLEFFHCGPRTKEAKKFLILLINTEPEFYIKILKALIKYISNQESYVDMWISVVKLHLQVETLFFYLNKILIPNVFALSLFLMLLIIK